MAVSTTVFFLTIYFSLYVLFIECLTKILTVHANLDVSLLFIFYQLHKAAAYLNHQISVGEKQTLTKLCGSGLKFDLISSKLN